MSTVFWHALNNIKGLGARSLKRLYQEYPDLSSVNLYDRVNPDTLHFFIKKKSLVEKIFDKEFLKNSLTIARESIEKHKEKGIEVIDIGSEYYPEILKLIDEPPIILYAKGNLNLLKDERRIAVVGTRNATAMGLKAARKIASQFSKKGYTIVSGLALGIDTAGHVGALETNGKTIAILAGSLDKVYPKENIDIANEIVEKGGLLLSEIALGQKTFRNSFVKRDRIQSGLSLGVCPVQTGLEGGTQHTIKFAQEQKRLLFCPEPLEPYEVESTQGIYVLLENNKAEKISKPSDYSRIISMLEIKLRELIYSNKGNIPIPIQRKNLNSQLEEQVNLFNFSNEKVEEDHVNELDNLLINVLKESEKQNMPPNEVMNRFFELFNRNKGNN